MPAIKQILTKVDALNGAQKRLGHYLQNDSTALLHSNVNDLAQAVGVSNSTVVRFAKSLGYKGFPEFKREIQKEMRRKLRAADRMEETFAQLGGGENILAKLINRDIRLLQEAQAEGLRSTDAIAAEYGRGDPAVTARAAAYLRDNVKYGLGPQEAAGLQLFLDYAADLGLAPRNAALFADCIDFTCVAKDDLCIVRCWKTEQPGRVGQFLRRDGCDRN